MGRRAGSGAKDDYPCSRGSDELRMHQRIGQNPLCRDSTFPSGERAEVRKASVKTDRDRAQRRSKRCIRWGNRRAFAFERFAGDPAEDMPENRRRQVKGESAVH
jgi:hypothetical protein